MKGLRVIFAGTPGFGLPCLEALFASKHNLLAVYTQPDRPAGRGRKLQSSVIKSWAESQRVPVHQPTHFRDPEQVASLAALKPDMLVVIAYGLILPRAVLDIPRFGCINVHASLLPRWRGASPIVQAIKHGDTQTGVTIMQMEEGLDTGPMLERVPCPIYPHDTAHILHDRLAQLAVAPLLAILDKFTQGGLAGEKQDDNLATYAPKIHKSEAVIDWQNPACVIDRQIRAFNPWPVAFTHVDNTPLRIYHAVVIEETGTGTLPGTILALDKKGMLIATGQGSLLVTRIQFPGGKPLSVAEWLNAKSKLLAVNTFLT